MFLWAAGEATVWPIIADFLLLPMAAVSRRRLTVPLSAALAGMALGGISGYLFSMRFPDRSRRLLHRLPLTPAEKIAVAQGYLAQHGVAAFLFQPYSGVPMKIWTVAAISLRLDPVRAVPVFIAARALRMSLVAVATRLLADRLRGVVRDHFILLSALYVAIFFAIWSRMNAASHGRGKHRHHG